jgi:thioesterase domain-containing protein
MMTLASWGVVSLHIEAAGLEAEVFVADSQIRYLAPLYADLKAEAQLAEGEDWPWVLRCLTDRGRARVAMQAQVAGANGVPAATLSARFALKRA